MGAAPAWCTLVVVAAGRRCGVASTRSSTASCAWRRCTTSRWSAATRRAGRLSICVTVHGIVDPARALRRDARARGRRRLGQRHARRCRGGAGAVARRRVDRSGAARAAGSPDAARCAGSRAAVASRMRASTCPMGCSPTWGMCAWPVASARRSGSMRCLRRTRCARSSAAMRAGICRRRAATTTSCASPRRVAAREAVETAARNAGVAVTRVGRIMARTAGPVAVLDGDGAPWMPGSTGWRHFAGLTRRSTSQRRSPPTSRPLSRRSSSAAP